MNKCNYEGCHGEANDSGLCDLHHRFMLKRINLAEKIKWHRQQIETLQKTLNATSEVESDLSQQTQPK